MLIVCPSCASEYTIDPVHVRPAGRTLRCAQCRATFFAAPPDETAEDAWADLMGQAEAVPAPASTGRAAAEPSRPDPSAPKRLAAWLKPSGRLPAGLALGVVALGLAGALVAARAEVVRAAPETARLYALLGLPVNLRGLEFRAVASHVAGTDAEAVLTVEGEIANLLPHPVDVPPILITLREGAGQALYSWTSDSPRRNLAPGDTTRFRARLAAPPLNGREVLVRFAPAGADVASRSADRKDPD